MSGLLGVADELFSSKHTIHAQVGSMFGELGAHTRSVTIARSRDLALLDN